MDTRFTTLVLMFCAVGIITGCLPVPYFSSHSDFDSFENKFDFIVNHSGTRSQVIRILGVPARYRKHTMSYKVCEIHESGAGIFVVLGYSAAYEPLYVQKEEDCEEVILYFDNNNLLQRNEKIPWIVSRDRKKEEQILRDFAKKGDPVAHEILDRDQVDFDRNKESKQFELANQGVEGYRQYLEGRYFPPYTLNVGTLGQEIGVYCPNADLGHADAQKHIGDLYYLGSFGVKKDLIRAYVWYTLAANGGDDGAAELVDLLMNELSTQQLNEAHILLEEWEPGQCKKNLMEEIPEKNE